MCDISFSFISSQTSDLWDEIKLNEISHISIILSDSLQIYLFNTHTHTHIYIYIYLL